MSTVYCLDCDRKLLLSPRQRVGDVIACPACDAEFELVSISPPEIDWVYDDDDDYDDYNDYDDDDSDDDDDDDDDDLDDYDDDDN